MARYTALIDGKAGAYGVVVPDLPGCTAMGKTLDEAMRNAIAATRDWAEAARAAGEQIPAPSRVDILRNNKEVARALRDGAALAVVPLIIDAARTARANLSLDAGLIEAIDEAAAAHGLTRTAFIASAAREKIAKDA